MNQKKAYMIGTTFLFSFAFSSFLIAIFYFGWPAENMDDNGWYALAGFVMLLPILILILANIGEKIKKIVLFIFAAAGIVASYFVLVGVPNYLIPTFAMEDLTLYMYFLMIGSNIGVLIISAAEMLRSARGSSSQGLMMAVAMAISGVIIAVVILIGANGWLYSIMLNNYIIPVALLLYFLFYPEELEKELHELQEPEKIQEVFVRDTTKGLKLALYTVLTCLNVMLVIAINGLGIPRADFYELNWVFWLMVGLGSAGLAFVTWMLNGKDLNEQKTAGIQKWLQIKWIILLLAQCAGFAICIFLEFFLPGFHESIYSHLVGGLVVGVNLGIFLVIVLIQHPPKSMLSYIMWLVLFVAISMTVGSYVKVMGTNFPELVETITDDYFLYIIGAYVILIGLLIAFQVVTIVKKSVVARAVAAEKV
ncbi:MAG: hypothetical protein ACFFCS_05010 [Candidatus Hodarchaeota archaeon]